MSLLPIEQQFDMFSLGVKRRRGSMTSQSRGIVDTVLATHRWAWHVTWPLRYLGNGTLLLWLPDADEHRVAAVWAWWFKRIVWPSGVEKHGNKLLSETLAKQTDCDKFCTSIIKKKTWNKMQSFTCSLQQQLLTRMRLSKRVLTLFANLNDNKKKIKVFKEKTCGNQ